MDFLQTTIYQPQKMFNDEDKDLRQKCKIPRFKYEDKCDICLKLLKGIGKDGLSLHYESDEAFSGVGLNSGMHFRKGVKLSCSHMFRFCIWSSIQFRTYK